MIRNTLQMPLSFVASGHSVVLERIRAGDGLASRLASMGLIPGVTVYVYRNDRNGPVVLGLNGARMMLGRGMADKMSVQEIDEVK